MATLKDLNHIATLGFDDSSLPHRAKADGTQTPYTDDELTTLYKAVEGATISDPGEAGESKVLHQFRYSDCKTAFVEPGASNMIDLIHPETGKSLINAETLEQIRERYPTAEIVNVDDWLLAKAARQDRPVIWVETTKERYFEMLEVLPPAYMCGGYFLVGEPWDHHAVNGRPRYAAFGEIGEGERYVEASRPMTVAELKALVN